jgi:hypothetical protein
MMTTMLTMTTMMLMMIQISHTLEHETSNTLHQSLKSAPVLKGPNTIHNIETYVINSSYDDDDDDDDDYDDDDDDDDPTTALLRVLFLQ